MKINRNDVVVGLIILAILAGLIYWFRTRGTETPTLPEVTIEEREVDLENKFRVDIPDDIEKAELKAVAGKDGIGIATRDEILVDLPDPSAGSFYQAWLEKDGKVVSLGKLRVAKGGWLIEYNSANYSGYNKVVISEEKVFDSKLETRVLEGSF